MIPSIIGLLIVIVACSALLVSCRRTRREKKRRRFVGRLEKALGPCAEIHS